ncbi:MAG: citryl-CoA lyase [Chloroflexota bacterium]
MARKPKTFRSDMGWSSSEQIVVKGYDLPNELLGKVNLGDMAFLELMDRLPTAQESIVANALLVTLVEHGVTPSALATRLTMLGAPESLQGGVAAGLLGLGSVFVGTIEGSAQMVQEALAGTSSEVDLAAVAEEIVARFAKDKRIIPGLGHPIHKPEDPRTPRLFAIAAENGFDGHYIALMQHIHQEAERHYQRVLPINATGAIGAVASELGIPWQICRGLGVMARAVGLVGHVLEEMRQPLAQEVWFRTEEEATAHVRSAKDDGINPKTA